MDNTYGTYGTIVFVPLEDLIKARNFYIMEHKKDKKKLFCKNIMCPCNNASGDDGTTPLEEYYCLTGFCEYPSAWMEVEL